MKKFTSIFLILLTIFSCNESMKKTLKNKESKKEFYSGEFKKKIGKEEFEFINLDSISNFSDLITEISNLNCNDKIAGLTFSFDNHQYNLIGYSECKSTGKTSCPITSSLIYVKNDSIITDLMTNQRIHISQLETILSKIESNNYKYIITNNNQIPIRINLDIDDKYSILSIKKILKEIITKFDQLDSDYISESLSYNILFGKYQIISTSNNLQN